MKKGRRKTHLMFNFILREQFLVLHDVYGMLAVGLWFNSLVIQLV